MAGNQIKSIGKKIESKAPIAWYVLESITTQTTDITDYVSGVRDYGRKSEQVIRFNFSWGITIKIKEMALKEVKPYMPNTINFSQLDVFAAAYSGGVWKGVRFYTE
jgi:hypothetical protein